MKKTENRGGARKGSGNKPKYGEETKTIAFRVPISLIAQIDRYIKRLLAKHKIKK